MADRDKPRDQTLQAWKTEYSWLEIDVNGMKCKVCKKWEARISQKFRVRKTFPMPF